jgi:hypothetical protein
LQAQARGKGRNSWVSLKPRGHQLDLVSYGAPSEGFWNALGPLFPTFLPDSAPGQLASLQYDYLSGAFWTTFYCTVPHLFRSWCVVPTTKHPETVVRKNAC